MAPRKKRPTKANSRKKPVIPKKTEDDTAAIIQDHSQNAPMRQHKKFGKFRFLLEEPKLEQEEPNPQECSNTLSSEDMNEQKPQEAVLDKKPDVANEDEAECIIIQTEECVEIANEECVIISNEETELTEQLTQLSVIENYPSLISEGDGEMFIDNVESDITVECVSEEVVEESDEQNVEEQEEEVEERTEEEPIDDEEDISEVNETDKKLRKKATKAKKTLPKSVTSKAKVVKNQLVMEAYDTSFAFESTIRRSSRIKSISVLKQRSKGHGLVKKCIDSDVSESSNSSHVDSEKMATAVEHLSIINQTENDTKPVKVKSRWRRSSELEMSISSPVLPEKSSPPESTQVVQTSSVSADTLKKEIDEEVANRLKQFVHLKENQYLTERVSCKEAKKMTCDCFLTPEEIERGEYGCGEDCLNRLLMIECGSLCPVGDRCTNKRFQKCQIAPCEVFRTEKKGLGIRASADIPYGDFLLEYVGEVLNPVEFEKRAAVYSEDKNQHYYFMSLRADAVIDATQKGNISRFINHSCDPNAETQKWTVNGELRIGFFSKRTIMAGEEITFDYQFQRYGKEAQKCYCEAATCRGWLGEEPDEEDEDEEDEDEEEEEEEEEKVELKEQKEEGDQQKITEKETESVISQKSSDDITSIDLEIPVEKPKPAKVKKEKKRILRLRKPLGKDIFEDPDLDEEIASLITTGLKNQAHTLKLSRLMVRAKEPPQRSKLLKLLRHGEFPCRRLFLDYHGLRLMHGWMTDAQQLASEDKKFESLRLELLQTLATLPIPNKTMLQDSKVLATVEKWAVNEKDTSDSPTESENNSPKQEMDSENVVKEEAPPVQQEEKPTEELEEVVEEEEMFLIDDIFETGEGPKEIRKSVGMEAENVRPFILKFPNNTGQKLVEELMEIFDDGIEYEIISVACRRLPRRPAVVPPPFDYEVEIVALAIKLLEEWSSLKEVFRIPKKERIEQMKEHEREADRKYKALLGLEQENEKKIADRYRYLQRHRPVETTMRRVMKGDDRNSSLRPGVDRHERRKILADEERRRKQREQWRMLEKQMVSQRFDPARAGFPYVWNPQTGQWQTCTTPYPFPAAVMGQPLMPLSQTAHYPFINQPPPIMLQQQTSILSQLSQVATQKMAPVPGVVGQNALMSMGNPPTLPSLPYQETLAENEDLTQVKFMGPIPPPVKLPPKWKCAKDKYGRPYYYHVKVRVSQWEPPEFPQATLSQDGNEEASDSSSSSTSSLTSDTSSDDSDSDDDIDDTGLLLEIRKKLAGSTSFAEKKPLEPEKVMEINNPIPDLETEVTKPEEEPEKSDVSPSPVASEETDENRSTTIDERLKEQFNLLKDEEATPKKRRVGLVQEIIISPRSEEDKQQFKEDLKRFKENKEKLKRQKALIMEEAKKQMKAKAKQTKNTKKHKASVKTKLKDVSVDMNSEAAKKIKEAFRSNMAGVMVNILNAYRKPDCKLGRIQNTEDFKHLARKLTHFVMLKEIKQCDTIEELTVTESVKIKAKEFVRKYMSKFGEVYQRPADDMDF